MAHSESLGEYERLPGIRVTGVSELVLEVLDLEKAEHFYSRILGLPVIGRPDGARVWLRAGDRTRIGLWRPQVGIAGGRGGIHVHYAMPIDEEEYEAALHRLRVHGYEPHEEKLDEGARALYVPDPDGNVVELNTRHARGEL